jgi:hypothetical protein
LGVDLIAMHKVVWHIVTFGIPLLGVVICTVGGTLCYRWAKSQRVGYVSAALAYLLATSLPIGIAAMSIWLGGYLGSRHKIYIFFGEDTWGLYTFMLFYIGFAIISNLALWVIFTFMRLKRAHT